MAKRVVCGLGHGDEGKGVVTEYLCAPNLEQMVVRFSGGQQAAHTVNKNKIQHVFHHFGSGTLSGCPTYWSKQCTMNPWVFMTEYDELKSKGIDPVIYFHPDCPVTTPDDMMVGQKKEKNHGTTGHGIYRTLLRHKEILFTVSDLLLYKTDIYLDKLVKIARYYNRASYYIDYIECILRMQEELYENKVFLYDNVPQKDNLVFEGSQGLMLDEKIGTMPHCTPIDVTPASIVDYRLDQIILVTRAYQSRHGNGPMTNGHLPVVLKNNENETCLFNKHQGEFRTTVLDLNQLMHAKKIGIDQVVPKDVEISLAVTCMDQLDRYVVTYHGNLCYFSTPERYVEFLAEHLNIKGRLYYNDSPYSNLKEI